MKGFEEYRKKNIAAEMKIATRGDFSSSLKHAVSVSKEDQKEVANIIRGRGEGRPGMIARNPKNHADKWYVAREYFEDNFELII